MKDIAIHHYRMNQFTQLDEKIRVVLVGRHAPEGIPQTIEIVEQVNIVWDTSFEACLEQFTKLVQTAFEIQAHILLQNVPGILGVVIAYWNKYMHRTSTPKIGVVISKPGPREAGKVLEWTASDEYSAMQVAGIAQTLAPNAKIEVDYQTGKVVIKFDPVNRFVFSHIEWI